MEIKWLGHSCFRIKGRAATIITDPFSPDLGYSLGKVTADIVTVSHKHPGHNHAKGVGGSPRAVTGPGEYEISEAIIIGIAAYHDDSGGTVRGKNTIYLMEMDEVSICHLGDLGHVLTGEQVEELGDVDILLLPVGGLSTIDATMAAEVVRQLDPKVVIPMHYKTPALKRQLQTVSKFLKEIGSGEVTPRAKLSIIKSNLPLTSQVVLLEY